jgi:hypothetical protein
MDPRERIAQNERLEGVLAEISGLLENADGVALVDALASNDTRALARALKVSPEALPDLIRAVTDGAGELLNLPEVKAAARLLSE